MKTKTAHRSLTRRDFLKAGSFLAVSTPLFLPSRLWAAAGEAAPNAKIVMGFIGMGTQNRGLLGGFLGSDQVRVVAVCDVDTTRREAAKKRVVDHYTTKTGQAYKDCTGYKDFRELLERKELNAVCIATPDHWHAIPVILACERKLDIYCEKPLSLTIAEARAMANAVRKHERVFQTGSMQRSSSEFLKACELARNGAIGKIKEVYVNVGGPSRWCDLPEQPMEPGLDWDFWLGQAPKRPYNSILSPRGVHTNFPDWRNYREYSGGGMTDWGAHHFDIAQWGLGMDESGPVEIIPPATRQERLTYKYENGVVMYHGSLQGYNFGVVFVGDKGKLCVDRGKFKAEPEEIAANYKANTLPVKLYRSNNHLGDFLQCIRSRQRPICDVEVGARSVSVCHLGNLAYWNKRPLKWDPKTERFLKDDEANKWRDRQRRAPWENGLGEYWKA
jgi:predicted dehydrogenase